MNLPFKACFAFLIIIPFSSSFGKSVSKIRKEKESSRSSYDLSSTPHRYKDDETCFDVAPNWCQSKDANDAACFKQAEIMSHQCMLTCKMCVPDEPLTDRTSKCSVFVNKHQETLCVILGWRETCPYSCRDFICYDKAKNCEELDNKGACLNEHHKYMTENCKARCKMCTPGYPVIDSSSTCITKYGLCNDKEWQILCPYTCRLFVQPTPDTTQPINPNLPQVPLQHRPLQPQPVTQPQKVGSVMQPQQQIVQPSVQTQMPSQVQPQSQITQIQQPVQQPVVAQTQVPPRVGTQTVTPVQTTQLQPQVQQPQVQQLLVQQPQVQQPQVQQPQVQQLQAQLPQVQQPQVQQPQVQQPQVQQPQVQQPQVQQPQVQQPQVQQPQVQQPQVQQPQMQQPAVTNPAVQPAQVLPQTQQIAPQVSSVTQATQLQPQQTVSQTTQTYQVLPQFQQTAPQVNPVTQGVPQVRPVTQANQLQQTAQPVQQQVLQPNQAQFPVRQPQVAQPQVNAGQVYQPVYQQPVGAVGPMKKQTRTKPAKVTAYDEETNNRNKMNKKGTTTKDEKIKTTQGTKEKDKENKIKEGSLKNHDLKPLEKIHCKTSEELRTAVKVGWGSVVKHMKTRSY